MPSSIHRHTHKHTHVRVLTNVTGNRRTFYQLVHHSYFPNNSDSFPLKCIRQAEEVRNKSKCENAHSHRPNSAMVSQLSERKITSTCIVAGSGNFPATPMTSY